MNQIIAKQNEANHAAEDPRKPSLPAAIVGGFGKDGKADNTDRPGLAQEDIRFQQQMGQLEIANRKTILDEKVAARARSARRRRVRPTPEAAGPGVRSANWQKAALQEDAAQLDGLTVVEKQKIDDQMLLAAPEIPEPEGRGSTRKSLDDEKKQYDQVFQGINRAFTTSINGILQGTQTWQQAMANIFTGILSVFVDMAEKMVAKWLESTKADAGHLRQDRSRRPDRDSGRGRRPGLAAYASTAAIPDRRPGAGPRGRGGNRLREHDGLPGARFLRRRLMGSCRATRSRASIEGEMIIPKPFADSMRENGGLGGGGQRDLSPSTPSTPRPSRTFLKNNSPPRHRPDLVSTGRSATATAPT